MNIIAIDVMIFIALYITIIALLVLNEVEAKEDADNKR
jgi:hypothetical protein